MLIRGDARMIPLRDETVQCIVTSPPYFGLRDYGTARWERGPQLRRPAPPQIDEGRSRGWRIQRAALCGPFRGAHFAVMPPALVQPCILAGSRPGDLVFDPFIGSGTVGQVADRLLRPWVGLDLSYQDVSTKRTRQRGLRLERSQS